MQLKITTNDAVRTLLCLLLHKNSGYLSSRELGEKLDISSNYIMKVLRVLTREKYVVVGVGKNGGFRINPDREPIVLYDVIALMEPTIKICDCLENHPKRDCSFEERYHMKEYWQSVQKKMDQLLSVNLEDFIPFNHSQEKVTTKQNNEQK